MRRPRLRALPLAAMGVLAVVSARAAGAPYEAGTLVCRFQDVRIAESSGLASSSLADDFFFTHNDSGDNPRVYAVSRAGVTLAMFRVTGAAQVDWEDMARAPGPDGRATLWLADIGDNERKRKQVTVYAVPEPPVDASRSGAITEVGPAVRYDLEYPDGPRDAEALLAHPRTGQLFIISKSLRVSGVYAAPTPLRTDAPNRLRKIGEVAFGSLPSSSRSLENLVLRRLATGGAISPDGARLVARTYVDAYEWQIDGDDVAGCFARKPVLIPLPRTAQGEAITYTRDGRSLLVSSEGKQAPVHELRSTVTEAVR